MIILVVFRKARSEELAGIGSLARERAHISSHVTFSLDGVSYHLPERWGGPELLLPSASELCLRRER